MGQIKRYLKEDYPYLESWYKAKGLYVPTMDDLPTYGLIEPNVAAGFLVLTDARVGWLEYYITNPDSDVSRRGKALDEITDGLIDYGKKFGLKYFKADTTLTCIGQRAIKHGFEYMGKHAVYFKRG